MWIVSSAGLLQNTVRSGDLVTSLCYWKFKEVASVIGEKSSRETEGFLGLCCKVLYLLSRLLFKQARTDGVPQFPSGINVLDVVDVAFVLSVSSLRSVFVLFCVCVHAMGRDFNVVFSF